MNLSQLINENLRNQTPYMEGLVNHLPMGQLALYKLTEDLNKIEAYTDYFNGHFAVDPVATDYTPATSIEDCLGKREQYEACLDLIQKEVDSQGMDPMIKKILNAYPLGISSGLFHVTIRLAYAKEGASFDEALTEEVSRALAYYVTAYRKVTPFYRTVPKDQIYENMEQLMKNPTLEKILYQNESLGQTMKSLYQSPKYLNAGFLIEDSIDDKVQGLLNLCIPAFEQTKSIIALHCITGLHAMLVLEDYFSDFHKALDIYTTAVITHLVSIEGIVFHKPDHEPILRSWPELLEEGSDSKDVHTIKFTYTCHELFKRYPLEGLKASLMHQLHK